MTDKPGLVIMAGPRSTTWTVVIILMVLAVYLVAMLAWVRCGFNR